MAEDSDSTFQRLFASGGIVFVGLVAQLGLGFLTRAVVARIGSAEYGAISLGITVMTTTAVFVVLGTDTGVGRYLPRFDDPERRRGVLVSAYQIVVPLSALAGAAVFLSARWMASVAFGDPSLAPVLRIFGLAVPAMAVVRLAVGSARGLRSPLPRVYIRQIGLPVARLLFVAAAVLAGFGLTGVAWAYLAAYAAAALLALDFLRRRTPLFGDADPRPMRGDLLRFSVPLMVAATMNILFHNLDTLMIGVFASASDVGVYNVTYPLAQLLTVGLTAFGFLFMPTISKLHSEGSAAEMERTYRVVSKWILVGTLPPFLLVVTYPDVVIRYTFGGNYVVGGLTLAVLAVGFLAHAVAGPSGDTLTAVGRSRLVMYINVAVTASNFAINLYLIPRYSYFGAAVATTLGYVAMNGLYVAQLYRELGFHPLQTATLRIGVATAVSWTALTWATDALVPITLPWVVAAFALYLPMYAALVLRAGGVGRAELALLESAEERLGFSFDTARGVARRLAR